MAVRKKIVGSVSVGDKIKLSPHLERVRREIRQLTPEEEDMETTTQSGNTEMTKATPKKPAAKKAKKPAAKANGSAEAGTPLATICKGLKMEPRKARRILRDAKGVPEAGARWAWTKAADIAKVKKILEDATSDK